MNNLAYSNQDPQKIAPKVEELLRKELGGRGRSRTKWKTAGPAEPARPQC